MGLVPTRRLLIWVAALGLPLAAAAPFSEIVAGAAGVLGAALVLIVALDAYRAPALLDGIRVHLPEIVRLFKDRATSLDVQIEIAAERTGKAPSPLRLGILLPADFAVPQEELLVELARSPDSSAESPASRQEVRWPCTPLSRGRFELTRCFIGCSSPLGFWSVRSEVPLRCELRVYPNLMSERKHVAALFLRRMGLGIRPQRQVGQGREFEKLREYIAGDSLNEIHWKATAKRFRPITKMFQLEKTQEVYVLIDTSRLSARGIAGGRNKGRGDGETGGRGEAEKRSGIGLQTEAAQTGGTRTAGTEAPPTTNFLERYITAALILGLAAERQGDLFGLLAFSDGIDAFLRASQGKQHFTACREALYTLQPRRVTPDYSALTAFIRTRLRRRALLVLLTSLDDPVLAESFSRNAALLSRQHLLLANMLRPPGVQALFSTAAEKSEEVYEHLAGHLLWSQLRELQQSLHHAGVQFSVIDSEALAPRLVSDYCVVKERQLV